MGLPPLKMKVRRTDVMSEAAGMRIATEEKGASAATETGIGTGTGTGSTRPAVTTGGGTETGPGRHRSAGFFSMSTLLVICSTVFCRERSGRLSALGRACMHPCKQRASTSAFSLPACVEACPPVLAAGAAPSD